MNQSFSESKLSGIYAKLNKTKILSHDTQFQGRSPVQVVYGGAHLFSAETPVKLGRIALISLETYASDFAEFGRAMWLKRADSLPVYEVALRELERDLIHSEKTVQTENFPAWLAWTIYNRTVEKLKTEPVEDFRIDFEDGYGFRTDTEEDSHAISASNELARSFLENTITPFCGFSIKSFSPETYKRAVRTLDLFLTNLFEKCGGTLPENFVINLPKITHHEEIASLEELLGDFEKLNDLESGSIKIEIMIETPQSIVNKDGEINLKNIVRAGKGRVNSAHFGAYDYTASFGIAGNHQHLQHEACNFARQMMQISLAPLGIRLSDSVTTELPLAVYKNENLTENQKRENKTVIHNAWRKHFNNVTTSLINGFYQSWDLHPAQLPARYAAVYAFFLESKDDQAKRLKGFIQQATRALTTGNIFDDAASAQGLLNFFIRAKNCGAISQTEITKITGLSKEDIQSASFLKVMENLRK